MTPTPPLKIAILVIGFPNEVEPSFVSAIMNASSTIPNSSPLVFTFFDPVFAQDLPDVWPLEYDLIVLGGGTPDPMDNDPWVLKVKEFIYLTFEYSPKQKIVGIGWGHQAICVTFGGAVENMEAAETGVRLMNLTPKGKKMFPFAECGEVFIHEFHRCEITVPAKEFTELACRNKAFLSHKNTILTFQGHPELDADSAKTLLAWNPAYVEGEDQKARVEKYMEREHDGVQLWERILKWVKERILYFLHIPHSSLHLLKNPSELLATRSTLLSYHP
jgi:GMP synthase-like glutamine amidotransferase